MTLLYWFAVWIFAHLTVDSDTDWAAIFPLTIFMVAFAMLISL